MAKRILGIRGFIYELAIYVCLQLLMIYLHRNNLIKQGALIDNQGLWIWVPFFVLATSVTVRSLRDKADWKKAVAAFGFFSGAFIWSLFMWSESAPKHFYDIIFIILIGLSISAIALIWASLVKLTVNKFRNASD